MKYIMCLLYQPSASIFALSITMTKNDIYKIFSERCDVFYQVPYQLQSRTLAKNSTKSHLRITLHKDLEVPICIVNGFANS